MLLGIDVGTTAVKALLIDDAARPLAQTSVEYDTSQPRPGWSEQNAEDWWTCLVSATRRVLAQARGADVRALSISTQGDTLVPVGADGKPLSPARTWMDTRGAELIPELEAALDQQSWYRITGARLGPYAAAITIAWLRENRPDVYRAADRFALVADFITERLVGRPALDFPNASRTLLFDIHSRTWSPELLAAIDLPEERLSPVAASGAPAGELQASAAEELGLTPGIPVAVGGHDQTCAAVGAGVVRPGAVLLSCGTAWVELAAVDRPLLDGDRRRVQTYCHAAPDRWALLTAHGGGNILAWIRDTLYQGEGASYEDITADAARADTRNASPLLLLPHFYGSASSASAHRAQGALLGLTLGHTRDDLALAALRGVALETGRQLRGFRAMGACAEEIRMIGGGARSDLWARMIADATGATVVRPKVREAAAFGAAILAGVAAGIFSSVDEVVDDLPIRDTLEPEADGVALYAELLSRFTEARESLAPIWEMAAAASATCRTGPP